MKYGRECCTQWPFNTHPTFLFHIPTAFNETVRSFYTLEKEWNVQLLQWKAEHELTNVYINDQVISCFFVFFEHILPPRPRLFLFNSPRTIDENTLNSNNVLSDGMRYAKKIFLNSAEDKMLIKKKNDQYFQCYNCEQPDVQKTYSVAEWDTDNGLVYQINKHNAKKFWDIMPLFSNGLINFRSLNETNQGQSSYVQLKRLVEDIIKNS
ncbi:hypothetical protein RFI_08220 [Reticulomyxa filosa]|uniref:Uncharacterized protein n=1 Tax=Reticulomyxa filosa TaxID=46433 RepID=X6NRK6_RETFI|nr:hypothetical protein RFI_08220 [Reticulomyxa filosa]|eukprot:ETO28905.1 hypothetical protein RFI_08220 [Reticulomyxa filosa]